MGSTQDHRRYAEECVAMAFRSDDDGDKVLWLTLAQSWVRLAELARIETGATDDDDDREENALEAQSPEEDAA